MSRQFNDPRQMDLLDIIKQQEATLIGRSIDEPGSLNMSAAVRNALHDAIKECPLSRWEIAAKMSELLDTEISKYQLDAWTSESKDAHRFPLEYAAAFCKVTGSNGPLQVVCAPVGMYTLDGPDTLRSHLQRLEEQSEKLSAQRKELKQMIKLFEGEKR